MSYNGSGVFTINTGGQPVITGTTISSTVFNNLTADLATGLTTALTKDGQSTPTANIGMGAFKITNLAAGTVASDAARLDQVQGGAATFITVTGTDTLTGTVVPALSAYATGNQFSFLVANTNTGAVTINVDGIGSKAITRTGTTALVAGDMVAGQAVEIIYDGTRFQLVNGNSFTNLKVSGTLGVTGVATFTAQPIVSSLTASLPIFTDASKGLVSNTMTGTGNVVMSTSPTLITPALGTPSALVGTNITGTATSFNINGTVGATTPAAGTFTSLIDSGNLTFTGTGNRITGDFSNATVANRVAFQTSTANSNTTIQVIPNGTASACALNLESDSAQANGTFMSIGAGINGNTESRITSGIRGTGTYLPLTFYTGGSERVRIDTSGNVGIGISAPSKKLEIYASAVSLQIESIVRNDMSGAGVAAIGFNVSSSLASETTSTKAGIGLVRSAAFGGGSLCFYNNNSGAAGDFTTADERMRIDSSGNVGIGTASPSTYGKFVVIGSVNADASIFIGNSSLTGSAPTYKGTVRIIDNPTSATGTSGGLEFLTSTFGSGYGWKMASIDSSGVNLTFSTRQNSASWTEAMRIDTSGNVGIGVTSPACILDISGATGGQIKFPATQNASANANTLDDYEEGTFTPTFTPTTSGTITINASFNLASYTKVGRMVTVTGELITTSVSSPIGVNGVNMSLPFTSATSTKRESLTAVYCTSGISSLPVATQYLVGSNSSSANISRDASTVVADTRFTFTFTYLAST